MRFTIYFLRIGLLPELKVFRSQILILEKKDKNLTSLKKKLKKAIARPNVYSTGFEMLANTHEQPLSRGLVRLSKIHVHKEE